MSVRPDPRFASLPFTGGRAALSADGVALTAHAESRARARCGLGAEALAAQIRCLAAASDFYEPGANARRDRTQAELWFAVRGPRGLGTAVCVFATDGSGLLVVTVRDARGFTQADRAGEPLTTRPFAALLGRRSA